MNRLAAFLDPRKTISDGVERAKLVESLGYESVWLTQVGGREATIVAAAYAAATSKINIGTAVIPIYPRTPVVMAQTAATVDELSSGRFILGIGTSHKITIEGWHGMELNSPLKHMREYVGALRAILRGEPYSGNIYRTGFQFISYEPVRRDLPIYISCLSPRMCRLAGEVADGAVLWMCAPGYIEKVVLPSIGEGREKAGKTMEGFEIVAAVPTSITETPTEGRNAFRRMAATYWNLPFYRAAIEGGGYGEALTAFDTQGPDGIPDHVIDEFAGIGEKGDALRVIESYRSAGVTLPAIGSLPRHEGAADSAEVLRELAPPFP